MRKRLPRHVAPVSLASGSYRLEDSRDLVGQRFAVLEPVSDHP